MEMEYVSEFPHNYMDRRPRKRPRLAAAAAAAAWDIPPQLQPRTHTKAQSGLYYGQVVGNGTSIGSSRMLPDHASLFVKGLAQKGSPPWRDDDKDGHYVFALGENLTSRYKIHRKIGEGTFGQVLECWDRETREVVAVKVVRSTKKYREAAMLEVDVLQLLGKYDRNGSRCVQIRNWLDYHNHICIVFEMLGPSLYDFLRKNNYCPFPVNLVRELGRQLLECVAFMHDKRLVHTDLKPENVLFVSSEYIKIPDYKSHNEGTFYKRLPKSSAIKVIDFGSTASGHQDHKYIVSTRHYRAPEVILGRSIVSDTRELGALGHDGKSFRPITSAHVKKSRVLHAEKYVRRGRLDWPDGATSRESIKAAMKLPRLQNLVMQHVDHSAGDIIDLLQGLLRHDPANRLTAHEALRHPFFTRYRRF